jgi:hypothetical protein
VRAKAGRFPVAIGLKITDGDQTYYHPAPGVEAGPEAWSRTRRTHTVAWSDLAGASLCIESGWGHKGTYFIDDCSLAKGR